MTKYKKVIIVVALVCLVSGLVIGIYIGKFKDIPFMKRIDEQSIGIYTGKDPFNLVSPDNISNPVLTAKDVTDISADFVADPFMVKESSMWYMFFEAMNTLTNQGDIGLAVSNDAFNWNYKQIVLDEHFHLSYPHMSSNGNTSTT